VPEKSVAKLTITKKTSTEFPDPAFSEALKKYWLAVYNIGYTTAYDYEAPYFRFCVPFQKYLQHMKGYLGNDIHKITVFNIKKVSDKCYDIPLRIHYTQGNQGETLTRDVCDRWIRYNDQWYHILQNKIVFPKISKHEEGGLVCEHGCVSVRC
jgi:hypothetical protein